MDDLLYMFVSLFISLVLCLILASIKTDYFYEDLNGEYGISNKCFEKDDKKFCKLENKLVEVKSYGLNDYYSDFYE